MTATANMARKIGSDAKAVVSPDVSEKQSANEVARLRPNELHRLRQERYGHREITPDDDGRTLVAAMLDCLTRTASAERRMANFLDLYSPWMPADQREAAIGLAVSGRRYWSASALGDALKLTVEERSKLRITTIRPSGFGDEEMIAMRKANGKTKKQAKRLLERLQPAERISRPAARLGVIMTLLPKSNIWVTATAIGKEIQRRKSIHFAGLTGANLRAALHDAVKLGIQSGVLDRRVVEGSTFKVAEICRREGLK